MGRLRFGSPAEAGLDAALAARIVPAAEAFLDGPDAAYPGFVLLAARHGVVVAHEARGFAVRHGGESVPMRADTVFDLASLSKLYTAVVVVRLAERGLLGLDEPVGRWLPAFRGAELTARRLLTHTSGLPAWLDLEPYADDAARLAAIAGLRTTDEPVGGEGGYRYSDLGLIVLGALAERATGRGLDALVAELVTGPLGLADTRYNPPAAWRERIAATEYQPWTGRGMVRGSVHDENAYRMGGVAGHAGVFATAWDVAVLAQTMLDGGRYGGKRLLGERWVREMVTDHNGGLGEGAARGLGWQLNQPSYMGRLASPTAFGHTGFTGTSVVADAATGVLLVLLTNRVHPGRDRGRDGAYRLAPAAALAAAAGL
ncbi:serine hydrolase domain-containing protein [Streptomyces sp. 8K308]|uniref:serine hydrolase domain-containing protein n=1 Tax=Streptomyces sp. 8K308 TaxID=2530388 RepID=UPI001405372A|nr:serine hydrolase domain-containing protein [Streptomyces sp. 8K308]